MLAEKKMLSVAELESQMAVELPSRDLMLVTVVIGDVLSGNKVFVVVKDVNVAAQLCANVLNLNVLGTQLFTCNILANQS